MIASEHVLAELGMQVAVDGDVVVGRAEVFEQLCVPGTAVLRTSVLTTWADVLTGAVAGRAIEPRIPLTLDLEAQVLEAPTVGAVLLAEATLVRAGRSVVVCEITFRDAADRRALALGVASFVPSPDPEHVFPGGFPPPSELRAERLSTPLAERIGCRVVRPGTVELPRRPDGLNAVGAIQGGLLSVAAEDAASSLAADAAPLASLNVRYLRPVMTGPAAAVATGTGRASVVHVTDTANGKVCAVATARLAGPR